MCHSFIRRWVDADNDYDDDDDDDSDDDGDGDNDADDDGDDDGDEDVADAAFLVVVVSVGVDGEWSF